MGTGGSLQTCTCTLAAGSRPEHPERTVDHKRGITASALSRQPVLGTELLLHLGAQHSCPFTVPAALPSLPSALLLNTTCATLAVLLLCSYFILGPHAKALCCRTLTVPPRLDHYPLLQLSFAQVPHWSHYPLFPPVWRPSAPFPPIP